MLDIMSFRFNAKNVFLTYPKCAETKEALVEWAKKLDPKPLQWCVAQEKHADGSLHLHCLLGYGGKINIRDQRHWDFNGHHPNIGPVRNINATLNYLHKEDEAPIISGFVLGKRGREVDPGDYLRLAESGEFGGAVAEFKRLYPKEYALNKPRVEDNLRAMGPARMVQLFPLESFEDVAQGWVREEKALFLHGPSGTGKTEYAKALIGEGALLVRHMDQLKRISPDTKGIIFDDMSFQHWPREAVIHLCDLKNDSGINVKHGCVTIPAGLPRIITHNFVDGVFPADPAGAIERRVFYVGVFESIVKSE